MLPVIEIVSTAAEQHVRVVAFTERASFMRNAVDPVPVASDVELRVDRLPAEERLK